jgi:chromosome segregation ATPase
LIVFRPNTNTEINGEEKMPEERLADTQMFAYAKDYDQLSDLYKIKKQKLGSEQKRSFKLEKENEKLREANRKLKLMKHTIVHRAPSPSMEIKELKEEKERFKTMYFAMLKNDQVKGAATGKLGKMVSQLKEENEKLKETNDRNYDVSMKSHLKQKEINELKEEIEDLKENQSEDWEKGYETCKNDNFELDETIKLLKEERGDILDLIGADDDTSPKDLYTMLEEMNSIHNKFLENESLGEKVEELKEQIHGIDKDGLKIEGLLDQLVRVGKENEELKAVREMLHGQIKEEREFLEISKELSETFSHNITVLTKENKKLKQMIEGVREELYAKDLHGEDIGWDDISDIVDYDENLKETKANYEDVYPPDENQE